MTKSGIISGALSSAPERGESICAVISVVFVIGSNDASAATGLFTVKTDTSGCINK